MARWNRFPLDLRTRMLAFLFPLGIGWLFAVLPDGPWWWPALALVAWLSLALALLLRPRRRSRHRPGRPGAGALSNRA